MVPSPLQPLALPNCLSRWQVLRKTRNDKTHITFFWNLERGRRRCRNFLLLKMKPVICLETKTDKPEEQSQPDSVPC